MRMRTTRKPVLSLLMLFCGCGGATTEISVSPSPVDLGTVLFPTEMPEGGYARAEISLENVGEEEALLTLQPWDGDRLCVEGFPDASVASDLTPMSPGAIYLLAVQVCGHVPGDFETTVESTLSLRAETGERFDVAVSWYAQLSVEQ